MSPLPTPDHLAPALLAWYDRHRRRLPWRAEPGQAADPYRVWLSEIMLQQTTVAAVGPYYEAFLQRWPTVGALAAAELDEVLHAWQGLGYYRRARHLHQCARVVVARHGGRFPADEAALRALPGIGAYTAAAVAAIAFQLRAAPVDGNIERVLARVFRVEVPLPAAKPQLRQLAAGLVPESRPGDVAQALMDLGATICTPRSPACALCPLNARCAARAAGIAAELPARAARAARPRRCGVAFFLTRGDGAILLRRRPEDGLLGGLMEVPTTAWREAAWSETEARAAAPVAAAWTVLPGQVRHVFTHFELTLSVWAARLAGEGDEVKEGRWVTLDRLADQALPNLMKKVLAQGIKAAGAAPVGGSARA